LAQSRLSLLLALEVAPCKRVREFTEGVIAPVDTEAAQTLLVGRDPQVRHELSGVLHHGDTPLMHGSLRPFVSEKGAAIYVFTTTEGFGPFQKHQQKQLVRTAS
jgi:hypothetical protein